MKFGAEPSLMTASSHLIVSLGSQGAVQSILSGHGCYSLDSLQTLGNPTQELLSFVVLTEYLIDLFFLNRILFQNPSLVF